MLRVLLVVGAVSPAPCGVGDYAVQLARALAGRAHVGIVAQLGARLNDAAGVELMPLAQKWAWTEVPKLLRAISDFKPDIVHFQFPSQGFFGRPMPSLLPLLCRLRGLRVVQTWHEPYRGRSLALMAPMALAGESLIFVRPNYTALLGRFARACIRHLPQRMIPNASALPLSTLTPPQRAALRASLLSAQSRLIVFFGFILPSKGLEQIFQIADPARDQLVFAGAVGDAAYAATLQQIAETAPWRSKVHWAGYMAPTDAANLLAVADAVVLPFKSGAGTWNTSLHGALAQGTLVITTSTTTPFGYDAKRNLCSVAVDDVMAMRNALDQYAGWRVPAVSSQQFWHEIADAHLQVYANRQDN